MSIRLKVYDDRVVLVLDRTSACMELPIRHGEPLFSDFVPGLPVHVEQDTTARVIVYKGWLIVGMTPLMPIGPQGSLGDGIRIVKHCTDSEAADDGVFPEEPRAAGVHDVT